MEDHKISKYLYFLTINESVNKILPEEMYYIDPVTKKNLNWSKRVKYNYKTTN